MAYCPPHKRNSAPLKPHDVRKTHEIRNPLDKPKDDFPALVPTKPKEDFPALKPKDVPKDVLKPKEKSKDKPKEKPKADTPPTPVPSPVTTSSPVTTPTPEPSPTPPKPRMDFSALFKNVEKKKNKAKKLKWGTVLLTKKGMVDSMTAEEREEEETWKTQQGQEERLWSMADRLAYQQSVRRVFDPHYESPEEVAVSASEEEPEEEEEVVTEEDEEDELEPEI